MSTEPLKFPGESKTLRLARADARHQKDHPDGVVAGCKLCLAEAAEGAFMGIREHWPHTDVVMDDPAGDEVKAVVLYDGRVLVGITYKAAPDNDRLIFTHDTEAVVERLANEIQVAVDICEQQLGWHHSRSGEMRYHRQLIDSWTRGLETRL